LDTPVLTWDPAIADNDPDGQGACYCCCSCFALDTPLEAKPGEFVMIQDIDAGDEILAAGVDLNWKPAKVLDRSGNLELSLIPGLYYVSYRLKGENEDRHLLVTPDHLFLMNTTKTLKKVQNLVPGDKLTDKNGDVAVVQFVVVGEHHTSVQSIELAGDYDPNTLDGHLVNSNGVVTADYVVQVHHEVNEGGDQFTYQFRDTDETDIQEVGTKEYAEKFPHEGRDNFLEDEDSWPKGFIPKRKRIVNIPKTAWGFLTEPQAMEVMENAEFNPYSNVIGRDNVERLFKFGRMLFPDIIYIIDWHNKFPNGYAWIQGRQKFLVVTGGLIRLKSLFLEGHSLIIAHLQAYLNGEQCVGTCDYEATHDILRELWPDKIYARIVPNAISQMEEIFSVIQSKPEQKDQNDRCLNPPLDCRIETFWAGMSFMEIPDCALPKVEFFELQQAFSSIDRNQITMAFSEKLDPESVTDTKNYDLVPGAKISKAEMDSTNEKRIVLFVETLKPNSRYILAVENINTTHGGVIAAGKDAVIFKTP